MKNSQVKCSYKTAFVVKTQKQNSLTDVHVDGHFKTTLVVETQVQNSLINVYVNDTLKLHLS